MRALILDGDGATLVMSQHQYSLIHRTGLSHLLTLAPHSWRAFEFCLGHTVADVPGVVNHLAKLMADENISILHHSTYGAEIFLVQSRELKKALKCVREKVDATLHVVLAARAVRAASAASAASGAAGAGTDSEGGSPPLPESPQKKKEKEGGREEAGEEEMEGDEWDRKIYESGVSSEGEGEGGREGGRTTTPAAAPTLITWAQKLGIRKPWQALLSPSSSSSSLRSSASVSSPPSSSATTVPLPSSPSNSPVAAVHSTPSVALPLLPSLPLPPPPPPPSPSSPALTAFAAQALRPSPHAAATAAAAAAAAAGAASTTPTNMSSSGNNPPLSSSPFSTSLGPRSPPLVLRVMPQPLVLTRLNKDYLQECSHLLARLFLFDRMPVQRFSPTTAGKKKEGGREGKLGTRRGRRRKGSTDEHAFSPAAGTAGAATSHVIPIIQSTSPTPSSSASSASSSSSFSSSSSSPFSSSLNLSPATKSGSGRGRIGFLHSHLQKQKHSSPSLPPSSSLPPFSDFGPLAFIEMDGELTLLLEEASLALFPPLALLPCPLRWRALKLCGRPFGFEETGLVAAMSKMDDSIPLLNFSTFQTNFTLVEEGGVGGTVSTLRREVGAGVEGWEEDEEGGREEEEGEEEEVVMGRGLGLGLSRSVEEGGGGRGVGRAIFHSGGGLLRF